MTQHMIFLNEQERDKVRQLQIMYKLKSVQETIKFLLREYKIRIDDQGFEYDYTTNKNTK